MKTLLLLLLLVTGINYAQPPIINPTPLTACDTLNDGFESFDLNIKTAEIYGSSDSGFLTIAYYISLADALSNTNPIANSSAFTNTLIYGQTLGVRVTNVINNEFATTTLDLALTPTIIANVAPNINLPEVPFDGIGTFNLTTQTPIIVGSQINYEIAYFNTLYEAEYFINPIVNPETFTNTTNPQVVYFGVRYLNSSCVTASSFQISVTNTSIANVNPSPLIVCDPDNDGVVNFNLTTKVNEILGSLSPSEYTVTFHEVLSNAINDSNAINNTSNYSSSFMVLYVRVEENINPTNFSTTTLQLIVGYTPYLPVEVPASYVYENPNDGVATFDLTQNYILSFGDPNVTVIYYNTQLDAINQINPIINPTAYTGNNLETIWARVTNTNTLCYNIRSFLLKVVDSALVVFIPDNNFKTKLLAANSSNQIAKDLTGTFSSVDTNGNGEIEFTEALNISYLDVNQSNIAAMTGLSSFTNLTYFDCRLNLVLNNLDVSSLTNLTYLNAYYAGLSSLTLTPTIVNLDISANSLTGSLDLTTFTNLQTFKSGPYNGLTSLNLSGLTNLISVDCSISGLSSLNVSGCSQLQTMNCSGNQINNFNTAGLTSLVSLDCISNVISTLNLTASTNLQNLLCSSNYISSIDLSSNTNLSTLDVSGNTLTSIDLSNNTNLITFYCGNDGLNNVNVSNLINLTTLYILGSIQTDIDLSNNEQLVNLEISNTAITNLDISATNVTNLYIFSNNNLQIVNLKNGQNSLNPNTFSQNPNLLYVCAEESQIPLIYSQFVNPINGNNPNVVVNSYCSFTPGGDYNTITGNIVFDVTGNGCDLTDLPQADIKVAINDGTTTGATFTNANSNYTFFTAAGTFELTPEIENPTIFSITPTTVTIPFANDNNNVTTQNFCMTANGIHPDVEIAIAPITPARPGFDAEYQIVYKNKGNQTLSGNFTFTYQEEVLDFISATSNPTLQNAGSLSWDYSNLLPFENRAVYVTLNVNSPVEIPAVNIDEILAFSANINPITGDDFPLDNTFLFNQTVVGSFDPNDITCLEGATVSPSEIGEYLHYVVNFENTGTFYAENVVLRLEIDETKYDLNSLQLLNTSHASTSRITNNIVEFIFEDIFLAALVGNPPVGGHGNVLFKIKSKDNLTTNDYVENSAKIYFDYNAPIDTNISQTTYATLRNPIVKFDTSISIYPNPTNNIVNIKSENAIESLELYDVQGRILIKSFENNTETKLDISDKQSGIYFLKITSEKGSKVEQIIKK